MATNDSAYCDTEYHGWPRSLRMAVQIARMVEQREKEEMAAHLSKSVRPISANARLRLEIGALKEILAEAANQRPDGHGRPPGGGERKPRRHSLRYRAEAESDKKREAS